MRFSFLLTSIFFLLLKQGLSQECGSISQGGEDPFTFEKLQSQLTNTRSPNMVGLATTIHIQRINGVAPIEYIDIYNELQNINELLKPTGFELISCEPYYIDDAAYGTITMGTNAISYHKKHGVQGTINMYFVNEVEDYCGFSSFPWYDVSDHSLFVMNACLYGGTFAHEIGHYFGLYHTHEPYFGLELSNGSNCSSTGDKLCDTPADPELGFENVNENCIYVGGALDPNQQAYNPDPSNLMSYARHSCRFNFSSDQLEKMRIYMQTASLSQDNCLGPDLSLNISTKPYPDIREPITTQEEIDFTYGKQRALAIEVRHSGLRDELHSDIAVYILNSDNSKIELDRWNTLSKPGKRLLFNKVITVPSFYRDKDSALVVEIDSGKEVEEHNEVNNIMKFPIGNELNTNLSGQFFPNPSSDLVTVQLKNTKFNEALDVAVYNCAGQLIKSEKKPLSEESEYFYSLNIENYPQGVYMVRFKWADNEVKTLRFVKVN